MYAATASISIMAPIGREETSTQLPAGGDFKNIHLYTSLNESKFFISDRNTVIFRRFSGDEPAAYRIAFMFSRHLTACTSMPPSRIVPVFRIYWKLTRDEDYVSVYYGLRVRTGRGWGTAGFLRFSSFSV